jgi:adenylate cyclase
LDRIRKAGGTDYFALALNRTFRRFPTVTWATDRPDGFSDADIAKLEDINPALAAIAETRAERRIGTSLLDTYLGPQAGRRILAGQILRAQGGVKGFGFIVRDGGGRMSSCTSPHFSGQASWV